MDEQKIITLSHLKNWVDDWVRTCHKNNVDPSDVPFLIENDRRQYRPFLGKIGFGSRGVTVSIVYFNSDIVRFDPKDKRPEGGGEYWKSRGASDSDVSGFVASRAAGLRLLRMVRYVLDTDEPKTWLDYREFEPNWIQFKFSAEEFDVEKLDQMARDNGNVLTETIVRMCVKGRKEE
jgi:hypothetical protein